MKNLTTAYQPIISFSDKKILGYEALLRAQIPTVEIIEKALSKNIIAKLDLYSHQIALKNFIPNQNELLFLNVHPFSLEDVIKTAKKGFYNNYVVFELIEHSNFDINKITELLQELKSLNIKCAIDDFGSGFNNINLLAKIKPDYVKIDKDIIQNVYDGINRNLIRVIVDWAKEDNIKIIAEGIETKEQYEECLELGFEYGQGYLIGKPSAQIIAVNSM